MKTKKILSLLLALAMVMAVVPTFGLVAGAAELSTDELVKFAGYVFDGSYATVGNVTGASTNYINVNTITEPAAWTGWSSTFAGNGDEHASNMCINMVNGGQNDGTYIQFYGAKNTSNSLTVNEDIQNGTNGKDYVVLEWKSGAVGGASEHDWKLTDVDGNDFDTFRYLVGQGAGIGPVWADNKYATTLNSNQKWTTFGRDYGVSNTDMYPSTGVSAYYRVIYKKIYSADNKVTGYTATYAKSSDRTNWEETFTKTYNGYDFNGIKTISVAVAANPNNEEGNEKTDASQRVSDLKIYAGNYPNASTATYTATALGHSGGADNANGYLIATNKASSKAAFNNRAGNDNAAPIISGDTTYCTTENMANDAGLNSTRVGYMGFSIDAPAEGKTVSKAILKIHVNKTNGNISWNTGRWLKLAAYRTTAVINDAKIGGMDASKFAAVNNDYSYDAAAWSYGPYDSGQIWYDHGGKTDDLKWRYIDVTNFVKAAVDEAEAGAEKINVGFRLQVPIGGIYLSTTGDKVPVLDVTTVDDNLMYDATFTVKAEGETVYTETVTLGANASKTFTFPENFALNGKIYTFADTENFTATKANPNVVVTATVKQPYAATKVETTKGDESLLGDKYKTTAGKFQENVIFDDDEKSIVGEGGWSGYINEREVSETFKLPTITEGQTAKLHLAVGGVRRNSSTGNSPEFRIKVSANEKYAFTTKTKDPGNTTIFGTPIYLTADITELVKAGSGDTITILLQSNVPAGLVDEKQCAYDGINPGYASYITVEDGVAVTTTEGIDYVTVNGAKVGASATMAAGGYVRAYNAEGKNIPVFANDEYKAEGQDIPVAAATELKVAPALHSITPALSWNENSFAIDFAFGNVTTLPGYTAGVKVVTDKAGNNEAATGYANAEAGATFATSRTNTLFGYAPVIKNDKDEVIATGSVAGPVSVYGLVMEAIVTGGFGVITDGAAKTISAAQLVKVNEVLNKGGIDTAVAYNAGVIAVEGNVIKLTENAYNAGLRFKATKVAGVETVTGEGDTITIDGSTAAITDSHATEAAAMVVYLEEVELVYAPETIEETIANEEVSTELNFEEIL